jgi:hypothetical protein
MSSGPTPEKPTLALVQKNLNNFYTKLLAAIMEQVGLILEMD